MVFATITVALIAVSIAMFVRPMTALGVLVASLFIYPEYLRVPMGLAQMSAPRFVAMAIVIRFLSSGRRELFKWQPIDSLIVAAWVWGVLANVVAGAPSEQLTYMVGTVFDTAMVYFAARVSLVENREWGLLLVPVAFCAIVIGSIGVLEAITHRSPYQGLDRYMLGGVQDSPEVLYRFGLLRAQGSAASPIYFGTAMTLLAGLVWALRDFARSKWLWRAACVASFLGALSSMSAGPQQCVAILVLANLLYYRRRLIKRTVIILLIMAVCLQLGSSRGLFYLVEYVNVTGGDYWYRARLLDVAVKNLPEYWLLGFGGRPPHHWGAQIDGRTFVDIVDHYVYIAVQSGLPGLAMFVGILLLAVRNAVRVFPNATTAYRKLVFGEAAVIVVLIVACFSIGLFGAALLLTYVHLGLIAQPDAGRRQWRKQQGRKQQAARVGSSRDIGRTATRPARSTSSPQRRPGGSQNVGTQTSSQ